MASAAAGNRAASWHVLGHSTVVAKRNGSGTGNHADRGFARGLEAHRRNGEIRGGGKTSSRGARGDRFASAGGHGARKAGVAGGHRARGVQGTKRGDCEVAGRVEETGAAGVIPAR